MKKRPNGKELIQGLVAPLARKKFDEFRAKDPLRRNKSVFLQDILLNFDYNKLIEVKDGNNS